MMIQYAPVFSSFTTSQLRNFATRLLFIFAAIFTS